MDLTRPIQSVIPTLDGPVLAALTSTSAPLALAEVTRRAGRGTPSGVRIALLRLVEHGIVLQTPGGYVLNRDHLAAPAIIELAALHGHLRSHIADEIAAWPTQPLLAALYGSGARRDGNTASDIDLLIVSDDDLDDEVERLGELIHRWTGNHAHIMVVTTDRLNEIKRRGEPILENWEREVEPILGSHAVLHGA